MSDWFLAHEPAVRLASFASVFAVMAAWETFAPDRARRLNRLHRWPGNLALVALSNLAVRVLFPIAAVGTAAWAQSRGFGLLPALGLPDAVAVLLAIVALDGAIWLQHVVSHRVPLLWRLHLVHHADLDLDVTSGTRFHPGEIVLSLLYKLLLVVALGPSPVAVLLFEVWLNAMAVFNHANVALPGPIERVARWLFVTPTVHRTHHSVIASEGHANFGFNLVIWDRIFGTYVDQPRSPLVLGLPALQATPKGLGWLLALPLTIARDDTVLRPAAPTPRAPQPERQSTPHPG